MVTITRILPFWDWDLFIIFDCLFLILTTRLKYQVTRINSSKTITAILHFVGLKAHATLINWTSHNAIRTLRFKYFVNCACFNMHYTDKANCVIVTYLKVNVTILSFVFCRVCTLGAGSRMV